MVARSLHFYAGAVTNDGYTGTAAEFLASDAKLFGIIKRPTLTARAAVLTQVSLALDEPFI